MKKIISALMALTLIITLAACSTPEAPTPSYPAPETAGEFLRATFLEAAEADAAATAEALATAVAADETLPFEAAVMPVEPGFLMGFTEEIDGFTEGAMFAPMIGTIPFVGYVFTVEGDVDAFAAELESLCDLRWNICTEAEEAVVGSSGDKVFFVMSVKNFEA